VRRNLEHVSRRRPSVRETGQRSAVPPCGSTGFAARRLVRIRNAQLGHVAWVPLERVRVRVGSTVESAAERRLSYRFHVPGAPTHAGRDSLLHYCLNRLAAANAGRWSLGLGHRQ
jgi:hypothetical protein